MDAAEIPNGFYIFRDVIPRACEAKEAKYRCCQTCLFSDLDQNKWQSETQNLRGRGVQQFGFEYKYYERRVSREPTTPLAASFTFSYIADTFVRPLFREHGVDEGPTQCIVNRYLAGEHIGRHTDHPDFGPVVCSVSLLDSTVFRMRSPELQVFDVQLNGGDIVVLTGEARNTWTHETLPVCEDPNYVRCSITFRTLRGI